MADGAFVPKAGDTVRLKSGGPTMTVTRVENEEAYCVWFEGNKNHDHTFPMLSLEKAHPVRPSISTGRPIRRS